MKKVISNKTTLTGVILLAFTVGLIACVLCFCDNESRQTMEISTINFIHLI